MSRARVSFNEYVTSNLNTQFLIARNRKMTPWYTVSRIGLRSVRATESVFGRRSSCNENEWLR